MKKMRLLKQSVAWESSNISMFWIASLMSQVFSWSTNVRDWKYNWISKQILERKKILKAGLSEMLAEQDLDGTP